MFRGAAIFALMSSVALILFLFLPASSPSPNGTSTSTAAASHPSPDSTEMSSPPPPAAAHGAEALGSEPHEGRDEGSEWLATRSSDGALPVDDVFLRELAGSVERTQPLDEHHPFGVLRRIDSFRRSHQTGSSASSSSATPLAWMRQWCSAQKPLAQFARPWKTGDPLGWGSIGMDDVVCIRGRRLFRDYGDHVTSSGRSQQRWWYQKTHKTTLYNLSNTTVAFPSLLLDVEGGGASSSPSTPSAPSGAPRKQRRSSSSNVDDPPERPSTHKYIALHKGIGVIAATFLHGFHVLVNTMMPLAHTLLTRHTNVTLEAVFQFDRRPKATNVEGPTSTLPIPQFDVTLLRHPSFGRNFRGGELLSAEIASPLATTPLPPRSSRGSKGQRMEAKTRQVRSSDDGGGRRLEYFSPRVLHRVDGLEDESTTHCYCAAVLHDMIDAEYMTSVPPAQRIARGDPLRRRSTRFVKESLNHRFGFAPYGTYPIPTAEYAAHGLWRNLSCAPTTPRMLLLLRNRTRELGDPEVVVGFAQRAGFNVHVMIPEREPIVLQARAARYADVMVAVHGQALTWSMMMDGTRATHCREVIELTGFGRSLRGMQNVFESIAADSYLKYSRTHPADVDFVNVSCDTPACPWLRRTLLTSKFPQTKKAFGWQRVWFRGSRALETLMLKVFQSTRRCIADNVPVVVPADFYDKSDRAVPNYPGGKL
jgi:hypothetical protein